ncbi:MAG: hypothetical protein GW855_06270 [Erythrobacter sp.]|nr:hypothetical protein [Erythrobacter sp.]NCQ64561.1 hypothetical protein [Alphaproteobacteria bacterium]
MKARFAVMSFGVMALALAGCGDGAEQPQPSEPVTEEQIAAQTPNAPTERPIDLLAEGVVIQPPEAGGRAYVLDFGDPEDDVVEALTMVFGGPQFGSNAECGAGPMEFATFDQFVANFQDDRFVGWSVNGPTDRASFSGPEGVTLGMAAADLRKLPTYAALDDSTLGEEFMLGSGEMMVSGLIEDNQVAVMWGGANCNFR